MSEGLTALIRAVDKFDPSRNIKFSSYASIAIHRSIRGNILNKRGLIILPPKTLERISSVKRDKMNLGGYPNETELAEKTGLSPDEVNNLQVLDNCFGGAFTLRCRRY